MNRKIEVSVILAAFNAERFVEEAVLSVCTQTYDKWELIVIDDCSHDNTWKILQKFADEHKVRLFRNKNNLGLAKSLNKGIRLASGKYIARLDADDIALPDRLEKQIDFLKKNKTHILVGSAAKEINEAGKFIGIRKVPKKSGDIKSQLLLRNPILHPSVMIIKNLPSGRVLAYPEEFNTTQDWALWRDLINIGHFGNLSTPLLKLRIHNNSISSLRRSQQISNSIKIQISLANKYAPNAPKDEAFFKAVNQYFFDSRHKSQLAQIDLLKLSRDVVSYHNEACNGLISVGEKPSKAFLIERCIQMTAGEAPSLQFFNLYFFLLKQNAFQTLLSSLKLLVLRTKKISSNRFDK